MVNKVFDIKDMKMWVRIGCKKYQIKNATMSEKPKPQLQVGSELIIVSENPIPPSIINSGELDLLYTHYSDDNTPTFELHMGGCKRLYITTEEVSENGEEFKILYKYHLTIDYWVKRDETMKQVFKKTFSDGTVITVTEHNPHCFSAHTTLDDEHHVEIHSDTIVEVLEKMIEDAEENIRNPKGECVIDKIAKLGFLPK